MSQTTMCLFCMATNVPTVWDESKGRMVTVRHKDEAHGTDPCLGSGI